MTDNQHQMIPPSEVKELKVFCDKIAIENMALVRKIHEVRERMEAA